ncbi:MAG: S8 family serine peptidase, partial [Firmicutes bacterium]|nr:S8 family serine peptidase [Bacillota bacterium]
MVGGFAAFVPGKAIPALAAHPKITGVHLDREARPCLDIGIPSVQGETAFLAGHTGRGVTIAIVDSGIHPHPDFTRPAGRLLGWYDAVTHRPDPYDDHGHGTHVAGIAAGNGYASGGKYRG